MTRLLSYNALLWKWATTRCRSAVSKKWLTQSAHHANLHSNAL